MNRKRSSASRREWKMYELETRRRRRASSSCCNKVVFPAPASPVSSVNPWRVWMAKSSSASADSQAGVEKKKRTSGETPKGFCCNPKNENNSLYVLVVTGLPVGGQLGRGVAIVGEVQRKQQQGVGGIWKRGRAAFQNETQRPGPRFRFTFGTPRASVRSWDFSGIRAWQGIQICRRRKPCRCGRFPWSAR